MQPGCPPRAAPRMETGPSTYRPSREPSPPDKCTCSGPNRPIDSLPLEQERLTMPSSLFRKAAFAALGFASCVSIAIAQTPSEINFGVISTEASVNQKKNWEPLVDAISKATGFKVKAFYASDYAGVIEAMRFNKVQIGWFGKKTGMEAGGR